MANVVNGIAMELTLEAALKSIPGM